MSTMRRRPGRAAEYAVAWLTVLPVVLALAACGGGSTSGAGTGGVAGTTASVGGSSRHVTVTESEYTIALSTTTLQPGATTFVAVNRGKVGHSLEIDGPGVSDKRIVGTIAPGSSQALTVTLRKGTYEIYCPVDGHKSLGMDTHLTVGSKTGGATPTTGMTTTKSGGGY